MTAIVDPPTQAAPNITPEYEVKFLLKPAAVLGPNNKLTSTILSIFDIPPSRPLPSALLARGRGYSSISRSGLSSTTRARESTTSSRRLSRRREARQPRLSTAASTKHDSFISYLQGKAEGNAVGIGPSNGF
ncbi:hypothetical protein AUP68_16995 [Ilyonectria robusta]